MQSRELKIREIRQRLVALNGVNYYMHGGCYEFACELMKECGGELHVNRTSEHCAVLIDGSLFDANGRIKDASSFRKARDYDVATFASQCHPPKKMRRMFNEALQN